MFSQFKAVHKFVFSNVTNWTRNKRWPVESDKSCDTDLRFWEELFVFSAKRVRLDHSQAFKVKFVLVCRGQYRTSLTGSRHPPPTAAGTCSVPQCYIKERVKCTLVQVQRFCTGRTAHRRSRGIAVLSLGHDTRKVWGDSVTPQPLFTPGKTRYSLWRRLGGPQGRSGKVQKISPPPGFDPWTVHPVEVLHACI